MALLLLHALFMSQRFHLKTMNQQRYEVQSTELNCQEEYHLHSGRIIGGCYDPANFLEFSLYNNEN